MNAIIACGGTGGHLFPGIAVAEVLRARGHGVMLFVSERDVDRIVLSEHPDIRYEKLPSIGLPSAFSPALLKFARGFNQSLSVCRSIYKNFKPQVILGMGGFTSTAPILAGKFRGIPTFIHESNAIPGKANKMTSRFVRAVLLGFKECAPFFPRVQTEITGTPIRSELKRMGKSAAREKLGLRDDLPTLLVMGGSQGATGINQAMIRSLPTLAGVPIQIIHLSGARDERLLADNYRRENIPAVVAAFHHRMEEPYSAADFAIARSGAASLAELAAFSLPAILVPFPYAADDHQSRNAEIFASANAAVILKEADITGDVLARRIMEMIGDRVLLKKMGENAFGLEPGDAASRVAETIEKYALAS